MKTLFELMGNAMLCLAWHMNKALAPLALI